MKSIDDQAKWIQTDDSDRDRRFDWLVTRIESARAQARYWANPSGETGFWDSPLARVLLPLGGGAIIAGLTAVIMKFVG